MLSATLINLFPNFCYSELLEFYSSVKASQVSYLLKDKIASIILFTF